MDRLGMCGIALVLLLAGCSTAYASCLSLRTICVKPTATDSQLAQGRNHIRVREAGCRGCGAPMSAVETVSRFPANSMHVRCRA